MQDQRALCDAKKACFKQSNAFSRQHQDTGALRLTEQPTGMLTALRAQSCRVDGAHANGLTDRMHRTPHRVEEGCWRFP